MSASTNLSRVVDLESASIRNRNELITYIQAIQQTLAAHNSRITTLENSADYIQAARLYIDTDGDLAQRAQQEETNTNE